METEYPPLKWAVPGMVHVGLTVLIGGGKLGKSFMAQNMACGVATGSECFGVQCPQGDVLMIDLENPHRSVKSRVHRLYENHVPNLPNIHFVDPDEVMRLGDGLEDQIRHWAYDVAENPLLVIIDVLQKVRDPAKGQMARKSDAYQAGYAEFGPLHKFAHDSGLAILLLHHTKKGKSDDPLEDASGSSALTSAADTVMRLKGADQQRTVYIRGREIEEREMVFEFDGGRFEYCGEASEFEDGVDEPKRSDARQEIMNVLRAHAPDEMTAERVSDILGAKISATRRNLQRMAKDFEIVKVSHGHYRAP